MNTIFFGTPDFAKASIRALLDAGIRVSMICTRPARRAGRGRVLSPTPVAELGDELGIPVIAPERFDSTALAAIKAVGANVFVVVAYGRFLPSEILSIPRLGVVNIHPSMLPLHRGPSPVATTILDGDRFTGVTVMLLDEGMDTGPILAQSEPLEISGDDRCDLLTEKLFGIGAEMLPKALRGLASRALVPRSQDDGEATVTRLIKKEDGIVRWGHPAEQIVRMNRAFHPWPGTSTTWVNGLFKLVDVELGSGVSVPTGVEPGSVFAREGGGVFVCAGGGSAVRLVTVQVAGRRAMSVEEFVVGHPEFVGSRLGAELRSDS